METKYMDYYSCGAAGYEQVSKVWNDLTEDFGIKRMNEYGYMVSFHCDKRQKNMEAAWLMNH